jgi:hypothetical protein
VLTDAGVHAWCQPDSRPSEPLVVASRLQ